MSASLLSASDITKSYAGVRALSAVSFDLYEGEVHALIGENGAGKSTLIKIMTGAVAADSGTLSVRGRAVGAMTPATSRALGIAAIYQQPALFPHLTVAENIAFALEPRTPLRMIDWTRRRQQATEILERVGAGIDADRLVDSLSMPEQQLVEIAKAIGSSARVLIMDEPTASLSGTEVGRLFDVVARLKSAQVGIIYISHRLEEILSIADRVTVLRDGATVGTRARDGLQRSTLINLMIGRELSAIFPKRTVPLGDVALDLRRVTCRAAGVHDVSLQVRSGEILGLAGLVGSGRTELAQTVFGLTPADSGDVLVRGRPVNVRSPASAIEAGIGYLPEDRKQHGVVPEMAIDQNISLASLGDVAARGLIDRARERTQAQRYVDQLRIKTGSVGSDVESLSGGNQQKVALARWLAIAPTVLLLDEPTQGVDVGSKSEIHALMQELAEQGLAVLMISSELPEILGMSDRVAVMRGGTIAGVLTRQEATQERIMAMAVGQ
ncbi:MAG TPA: sugar ABC transporter ATP-binding protein [Vicinamibacterales bacterium]|nr:sugar ABC transporter ATP-binding protein [Vicinamibacterales bacterium]